MLRQEVQFPLFPDRLKEVTESALIAHAAHNAPCCSPTSAGAPSSATSGASKPSEPVEQRGYSRVFQGRLKAFWLAGRPAARRRAAACGRRLAVQKRQLGENIPVFGLHVIRIVNVRRIWTWEFSPTSPARLLGLIFSNANRSSVCRLALYSWYRLFRWSSPPAFENHRELSRREHHHNTFPIVLHSEQGGRLSNWLGALQIAVVTFLCRCDGLQIRNFVALLSAAEADGNARHLDDNPPYLSGKEKTICY